MLVELKIQKKCKKLKMDQKKFKKRRTKNIKMN